MSLRYYVYLSNAKVDMLLAQVDPGFARRRTTEVSVNLPGVGARRGVDADPDRVSRLERVVRYLEDHGDLGTVDEPGQYFWGLLPMRWGRAAAPEPGPVYFGGRTELTIVCLGGSASHLIGAAAGSAPGYSQLPMLLAGLADPDSDVDEESLDQADEAALAAVHQAGARLRGPAQNMEFVAKRLLSGPSPYPEIDQRDDMTVLLGSPLYVALAD